MLVKFEQNRVVQTSRNFEHFDQKKPKTKQKKKQKKKQTNKQTKNKTKQNKNGFLITIFDKKLTPFLEDVSVAEIIV